MDSDEWAGKVNERKAALEMELAKDTPNTARIERLKNEILLYENALQKVKIHEGGQDPKQLKIWRFKRRNVFCIIIVLLVLPMVFSWILGQLASFDKSLAENASYAFLILYVLLAAYLVYRYIVSPPEELPRLNPAHSFWG